MYVIGGPNGAGKTTFAKEFLPKAQVIEFLNADLLAAGLSPFHPESMTVQSGRILLARWRKLVCEGKSFAFESTLSGRAYAKKLQWAKSEGFSVRLCYLWLPSVRLSLERVRLRVQMGGHNVAGDVLRRRFLPSLNNFYSLYLPLADEALLFTAVSTPPKLVARWVSGNREVLDTEAYERIRSQISEAKKN